MEGKGGVTPYKTPKSVLARMQAAHFGKILFNLQFLAVAVMAASALSVLATVMFYLFMIIVTIGSIGLIYVLYPPFASWWAGGEKLQEIMEVLAGSWQYAVPVALALSLSSIVLLCFDKEQKQVGRIVVSALVALFSVVFLIFKWINEGGAA